MCEQLADVEIHASESGEEDQDDDYNNASVDLIDERLYLGNLMCARDSKMLERLNISHILTIDLVPLPRTILDRPNLTFKFVKLADIPKEDLICHLPTTNEFIKEAVAAGGTVLVHCYFGVSRSAAVVIAYMMEKYALCYEEGFRAVQARRRYIGPNVGFVVQLKLFGHMGYTLNREDPRYKQFRLKLAGQKLKQVKILPQLFADLIKPDPGLTRERPDPLVYRCRKCRRVVASQTNIIPHVPKPLRVELAKKALRPPPANAGLHCVVDNGQILMEKLQCLSTQISNMISGLDGGAASEVRAGSKSDSELVRGGEDVAGADDSDAPGRSSDSELATQDSDASRDSEDLVGGAVSREVAGACRLMWFVEPMSWMRGVTQSPHGKLHCPKCQNKIGSFSWIMGCKCPCGQKVAPAFYLVPSKVESSNIVQNVQVTV